MNHHIIRSITAVACLLGAVGCREINDVRRAGPAGAPRSNNSLHLEQSDAKFGMTGYQPGLTQSHTGNGQMGTAGLRAHGGGPAATRPAIITDEPVGLAPDQHIGTTSRVRDIRVVSDPTTHAVTRLP